MTSYSFAYLYVLAAIVSPSLAAAQNSNPNKVTFAGRSWDIRAGQNSNPGPNDWSDAKSHVWMDARNQLHLAVRPIKDKWHAAEVWCNDLLGPGEYRWVISGKFAAFEPQVVLGLFLFEDPPKGKEFGNEITFEVAKFGDAQAANSAQFSIHPHRKDINNRVEQFALGNATTVSVSLRWEADQIVWRAFSGRQFNPQAKSQMIHTWKFNQKEHIPLKGDMKVHMNFWIYTPQGAQAAPPKNPHEVIIESFQFLPLK